MNRGKSIVNGSMKGASGKISMAVLFGLTLASGCTTVLSTNERFAKQEISIERDALKVAAAEVSTAKWPKPEKISLSRRLFGDEKAAAQRVSKTDAVSAYVASLSHEGEPMAALMADADHHLRAARRLVGFAHAATDAIRPTMSDVATLERAIGDLRECREIYVSAIKILAAPDNNKQRLLSASIRYDFGLVISDIGAAADALAEKAANDQTETFAGPGLRFKLNGS